MAHGCKTITETATEEFASESWREVAVDLMERGADAEAFVEAMAARMEPGMASLFREEFHQLPSTLIGMIVDAWAMAEAAGKGFRVQSVPPASPLDFARNRRVRVAVDADDQGVVVSISHVPGRHAEWYQPVAAAASA